MGVKIDQNKYHALRCAGWKQADAAAVFGASQCAGSQVDKKLREKEIDPLLKKIFGLANALNEEQLFEMIDLYYFVEEERART